jgi:hypothetical protein
MARTFLIRGMICGIVAGLLVFLYAKFFGEPTVDGAIGVEELLAKAAGEMPEADLVSRDLQSTWGLFTGVMLFSVAIGGLFSLLVAYSWGRMGKLSARSSAALLAGASFIAIYAVPFLKYPANPPSVGNPDTIGYRTGLYFGMIVISIIAMIAVLNLSLALARRMERWHAALIGGAAYLAIIVVAYVVMPSINEVPEAFPATLLWSFRTTALTMQLILWAGVGLLFGELTQRSLAARRTAASPAVAAARR